MKQKLKQHVEKFKSLEKGQKVKVIAVAVLLIVIVWMVLGMFAGSDNTVVSNSQPVKTLNSTPVVKPQVQYHVAKQAKIAVAPKTKAEVKAQSEYLKSVNQLQMLQLQQQIAQTKQQIAAAELQSATANKKIKALTAPPPPPPVVTQAPVQVAPATVVKQQPQFNQSMKLVYLANESGKWQIIVNNGGQLINATVGSLLPDGSKIVSVKGSSIVLNLDGHTKTLSIETAP